MILSHSRVLKNFRAGIIADRQQFRHFDSGRIAAFCHEGGIPGRRPEAKNRKSPIKSILYGVGTPSLGVNNYLQGQL